MNENTNSIPNSVSINTLTMTLRHRVAEREEYSRTQPISPVVKARIEALTELTEWFNVNALDLADSEINALHEATRALSYYIKSNTRT